MGVTGKNEQAFRTIGEVAESLDLPPHVLRFWETRFKELEPVKRAGGRRYYRPRDVELVNVGVDQGAILQTMKTGRIDGVSFAWPLTMIAETNNIGKGFIEPAEGDVPSMRDQIQGVVYAKPDLIAKKQARPRQARRRTKR